MSKSLEFCKKIAGDKSRYSFSDRDFSQAKEYEAEETAKEMFPDTFGKIRKYKICGIDDNNQEICLHLEIEFNPNTDFDYCVSESFTHDGTLLFVYEAIESALKKIFGGSTYCVLDSSPRSGDTIHYIIGNIILLNETGNFGTKEKPWLNSRVTVMVPVIANIIRN